MWLFIIVGIILIFRFGKWIAGLVFAAVWHLLFHPRINSALAAICIFLSIYVAGFNNPIAVLLLISMLDCIRDFVMADKYYLPFSIDTANDRLYRIKSICSLLTFGLSRAVFALVVYPKISVSAFRCARRLVIPYDWYGGYYDYPGKSRYFCYQHSKFVQKRLRKGKLVSNEDAIKQWMQARRYKAERVYQANSPQNVIGKIAEAVAEVFTEEGKERAIVREDARKLTYLTGSEYYAYIDVRFYHKCKQMIAKAMENRSTLRPQDIMELDEVKNIEKLPKDSVNYIGIFILEALVQDGIVEKVDLLDDVRDIWQYRHVQGKQILCRDAANNPLLALDDDE